MKQSQSLAKILHLREWEKHAAEKAYQESQERFEQTATKLYRLLRKKEDAEATYDHFLQTSKEIRWIKEQVTYIEKLTEQVFQLQPDVQQAREEMEHKQSLLAEAYVEVKKYEKVIERRKQKQVEQALQEESKQMDAISIQQFLSRKNG